MWKEILVDDIEGLEKCSEMVNVGNCSTAFICSIEWLQLKLKWMTDATCYLYEDDEMKSCTFNSYDAEIDRVINNFYYTKYLKKPENKNKVYEVSAENCKVVLERYNKIIRVRKYADWHYRDKIGRSEKETTHWLIKIYENIGIRVTDFEKYWEYELI